MNWQDIKSSIDNCSFEYNGQMLFGKRFLEVLNFHAPGIAAVKDHTGAYHITAEGQPLYPQRYLRSFGFYCGRAAVVSSQGWFHINEEGREMYQHRFAWAGNYQEGICPVRLESGAYIHINTDGVRLSPIDYLYCGDFKDGVAAVQLQSGLYTHILSNGHYLHNYFYQELGIFHKNYATARDERGWCHINKTGLPLYSQRYLAIEPFYNGQARVRALNGELLIINERGDIV